MNRPWLTFDSDGTPRVHIPLSNGGDMSVACTLEGLTEFLNEARVAIVARTDDPAFQKQVGQTLLGIVKRWF